MHHMLSQAACPQTHCQVRLCEPNIQHLFKVMLLSDVFLWKIWLWLGSNFADAGWACQRSLLHSAAWAFAMSGFVHLTHLSFDGESGWLSGRRMRSVLCFTRSLSSAIDILAGFHHSCE